MEERKWEDLGVDCLVNVFERVGTESLLLDVPFVCKSWYKASLQPSCWRRLAFPARIISITNWNDPLMDIFGTPERQLLNRFMEIYKTENCSVDAFIKFIVGRSHGSCTYLTLPSGCTDEVLKYITDECPALKTLLLPGDIIHKTSIIPTLIGKCKHLENLILGSLRNFVSIITQISLSCKNFCSLRVAYATISEAEASAIVTYLPNIKYLVLTGAWINLKSLEIILRGCKSLVYLDVSDCLDFDPDEKVLEMASHVKTFKFEGSLLYDYIEDSIDRDDIYDGYILA